MVPYLSLIHENSIRVFLKAMSLRDDLLAADTLVRSFDCRVVSEAVRTPDAPIPAVLIAGYPARKN